MKYDYQKAKRLILDEAENLESASLGMREDWGWTADTIWTAEKGFCVDIDDPKLEIAGINGSRWATPTLEFSYKNKKGETKLVDCFVE
jgi:hypothetical protein